MAEKDVTEKVLEAYDDVFADIVNVLLFRGKRIIQEDELEQETPRSHYKIKNKLHEQERDVAKYWKHGTVRIACLGMENQTDTDKDMPLRVISYDGAAYRAQLLKEKDKEKKENENITGTSKKKKRRKKQAVLRYPVITLVLYFGYKHNWDKPYSLLKCLEVPVELEPYVSDYKINVFEIAYLTDEQVNMFNSDFKIVADYFVQMRKNRYYVPSDYVMDHVHETLELMSAVTDDDRFELAAAEMKGERRTMCEFLDKVENRGKEIGKEIGMKLGKMEMLCELVRDGLISIEAGAKRADMTEEQFTMEMEKYL